MLGLQWRIYNVYNRHITETVVPYDDGAITVTLQSQGLFNKMSKALEIKIRNQPRTAIINCGSLGYKNFLQMTQQLTTLITQKYTLVFCNPPVGYEFKHKTETIIVTNEDGEHHIIARNVDFKQLFPLATIYVGHIGIGAV